MSLGRGLESLIPPRDHQSTERKTSVDESREETNPREHVFYIEVDKIKPNPYQPRREFNEEELASLARSIREHGILQPLVVTKEEIDLPHGRRVEYHIVAGERRLRAAKLAGFNQVPAIIREATNQSKLELALIENVQRSDLNPIEEAKAYTQLTGEFSLTQEQVAERVGKSREFVANKLRLLNLPHEVQSMLAGSFISEGHAKVLLSLKNPEKQIFLAHQTLKNSWTVRVLEEKVKAELVPLPARPPMLAVDPVLEELKRAIEERLGAAVSIQGNSEKGKLAISFSSKEELNEIIGRLTGGTS